MRELPIIITTEMVKAILDGRKLVTRRLNGLKEINKEPDRWKFSHILCNPPEAIFEDLNDTIDLRQKEKRGQKVKFVMLPYQEGDLLWVKETFLAGCAARTWLEVVSVRPERLQDITWVWRIEFKSG